MQTPASLPNPHCVNHPPPCDNIRVHIWLNARQNYILVLVMLL